MAETLAQEQRRIKPRVEDLITARANMNEEAKQLAFSFLEYCIDKNIKYDWSSTNRWNLKIKGRSIGYVGIGVRKIDDDSWNIIFGINELLQYEYFILKEDLAETIHNNIHFCGKCHSKHETCALKSATILGKEYHNICGGNVCFKNPDSVTIASVRKIIDFILTLLHGTTSRPIRDNATSSLTRIDNKLRVVNITDSNGNTNENMDSLFGCKFARRKHDLKYFYVGRTMYSEFNVNKNIHEIIFELNEPIELLMYSLTTSLRLDVPECWSLYGAAAKNEPWVLIDEQAEFPRPVTLYTEKAFKIDNPKSYRYYRILFKGSSFVLSLLSFYIK